MKENRYKGWLMNINERHNMAREAVADRALIFGSGGHWFNLHCSQHVVVSLGFTPNSSCEDCPQYWVYVSRFKVKATNKWHVEVSGTQTLQGSFFDHGASPLYSIRTISLWSQTLKVCWRLMRWLGQMERWGWWDWRICEERTRGREIIIF